MRVSFHLRKDKLDKENYMPLRMLISANGFKIFKAVQNVRVKHQHWDEKNQRIKSPRKSESYNSHIEYNKIIDEKEDQVKKLFRYILLNNIEVTKDYIQLKLKEGLETINLSHQFFPSFQEFINTNKTTKSPRTIKTYVTNKNFLQEFENSTGYKLHFESINVDFFEKLRDYAFDIKKTKNNYFSKIIAVLKTFMNWAYEREYHENLIYKKFKKRDDETEVIYLTMDELMSLYNFEFKSKRLEYVRDVYCFGCFTGLRFSDIRQLRTSNVFKDHLKLNIQKTKTIDHIIPLNTYSRAILDKYKETIYEPLPIISEQKFNKYIKECAKDVEINTLTTITRYIGQKRIDKTVPKHQLITSHTARKTFVTNSLILGMKEMVVRNITGHKKEDSFRRYVKIAEDFKKSEMDNTWDKL